MKIAIAGASGLVGSALLPFLTNSGHEVVALKRGADNLYSLGLNQPEVLINLSGENIASRWSESKKQKIRDSRILTTKGLVKAVVESKTPPKLFLNASAIGFYGNRGEVTVDESSKRGEGFLADVVKEWEDAVEPAKKVGIRSVSMRFGAILSPQGGALGKMLLPFRLGLGGPIGAGKQFMSWIAIEDVLGAILHLINEKSLSGPVNIVAPHPERNEDFTSTLAKVLHRPAVLPMPEFAVKLLFGQMGEEVLLGGAKVEPKKLLDSGYPFLYPDLASALTHLLGGYTDSD